MPADSDAAKDRPEGRFGAAALAAAKTEPTPPPSSHFPVKHIVLTGFMAAGKTTVGLLLATRLNLPFIDADDYIQDAVGMTIPEIFRIQGEPAFREFEHQAIACILTSESLVLAMGGGAIEDPRTRALLLSSTNTRLIYLDASLQTALDRCGPGETSNRPVLADRANLEARYQQRLPLYRQSHHIISVDTLTPEQVADAILQALQSPRDFE